MRYTTAVRCDTTRCHGCTGAVIRCRIESEANSASRRSKACATDRGAVMNGCAEGYTRDYVVAGIVDVGRGAGIGFGDRQGFAGAIRGVVIAVATIVCLERVRTCG